MTVPSPNDPRLPPLGTVIAQRYRLDRFLGAGGMGAVYDAATSTGERCALKILFETGRGSESTNALARFVREARVTSSLSSPNVVRVFDGGVDPGTRFPYIAMELLSGEDLDALGTRLGPLHPVVAIRLAIQAARGLAAAHAMGIVHRDVKPSNVFLDARSGSVVAKVCDFGLAKAVAGDGALTATGSILGSPLYMAPEQLASARNVDARADVWSLAMTLYQALAGVPAFRHVSNFTELAVALTTQQVPHLQEAAPWIDGTIATIVHGALVRDPARRCPSAEAFAQALLPFAGGQDWVSPTMLQPLGDDVKSTVAERVPYPLAWNVTSASVPSVANGDGTELLIGARLGDKYEVLRLLGEGGMGAVYEAKAPDGTRVAVKVLHIGRGTSQSGESLSRFVREARAAMSIASPHVVRVLDADTDRTYGVPYIVMELLRGADLDRVIKDHGALEPSAVAAVFVQACDGLAAAHALGIVHRDIKPANIFLHEDERGAISVKICDFGVAKQTQIGEADQTRTELTRTGGIVGSPMYMSPEQAKNAKVVDARSDLFSLAMSMHQALSGKKPWEGCSTVGELIVAICTKRPTPIQDLAPWVEPGLADALHRDLAFDPAERHPSARDLAAELEPFASKTPVTRERLAALDPSRRALVAPRASSATSRSSGPGSTTVDATAIDRSETKKRSATPWIVGAAAIVAIAASGLVVASQRRATPSSASAPVTSAPETASAAPPVASATKVSAKLLVAPEDATVSVNGSARATDHGVVVLEGEPGDSFDVVVEKGKSRSEAKVMIGRDGEASPDRIALPTAPPAPKATGPIPPHVEKTTVATPPQPPTPPPPSPTPASTPKPKDDWN